VPTGLCSATAKGSAGFISGPVIRQGTEPWAWFITLALPEVANGIAWTLDEAKHDWREAWDRIVAKHGEAAVEKALEAARASRERQDAWSEKHGPRRA
jgi:hypothetical protein